MKVIAKGLLAVPLLITLVACGHHRPAPIEEYSATRMKSPLSADGTYHVRPGDTLYAIAFSYGLDHREVAAWNGIPSPYVIYPGQNIRLSPPAGEDARHTGKSSAVQITGIKAPGEVTTRAHTASTPPPATATKPTVQTSPARKTSNQSSTDPKSWRWPTSGRVLRGYVAGDPARNGLDIAGKEGQPVKASSAGKVVYSGNGLIGYGELIIIKHSERMLSAYAHNRVRLVQEGEQVSAGQKIAEMGRNDQNEQLLHFEIRIRGKPVNPLRYLPAK